jgi:hypothetical protein
MTSFNQSGPGNIATPGTNGSFSGVMAGVYTGTGNPLAPGPFQFTVTNDVSQNWQVLTINWFKQVPPSFANSLPSGTTIGGYTQNEFPFTNYTGRNYPASQVANTQIWELGNSLSAITGRQLPTTWNIQPGPQNTEPGHALLGCYTGAVVISAMQGAKFFVRRSD